MTDDTCKYCPDVIKVGVELAGFRREVKFAIQSSEKAMDLARSDLDRRLEGMNEFREQLTKQAANFMTRSEDKLIHEGMEGRLRNIEKQLAGRAASAKWSDYIITVLISAAVALMIVFLKS